MYSPKPFKIEDSKVIEQFIRNNGLATLISSTSEYPIISVTPLLLYKENSDYILKGHLSKANKHIRYMHTNSKITAVFYGSQGYISAYAKDPKQMSILPTWDYQVVQVTGELTIMDDEQLELFMKNLVHVHEKDQPKSIDLAEYPKHVYDKKIKAISGFQIKVKEWHGCFRLNQNRTEEERNCIKQHVSNTKNLVKAIEDFN